MEIAQFVGRLDYFLLFLFRTAAFLLTVPILGLTIRNRSIKAAFALLLSILIFPVCSDSSWHAPPDLAAYVVLVAKESLIGLFLSFVVLLTLSAVQMAGDLVGMEMGLNLAAQLDPVTGSSTPLIAYFYEIMAVLIFLSLNFHHWLLQGLSSSYEILPVGSFDFAHYSPEFFISLFRKMFVAGIVLAAPVFTVMAIVSLAMGLLARAVPNFNILDAGYTMRVGVAFLAMICFLPGFVSAVTKLLGGVRESMFQMLRSMA